MSGRERPTRHCEIHNRTKRKTVSRKQIKNALIPFRSETDPNYNTNARDWPEAHMARGTSRADPRSIWTFGRDTMHHRLYTQNMWHGMNAWHKGGLVQLGPPAAATTGRWTTCSTQQHSASSAYDASAFDAHLVHAPRCGYVWRQGWQRRPASRSGEEALARARGGVRGCHSARHGARWMRRHALEWPFGSERGAQHRAVVRWERRH